MEKRITNLDKLCVPQAILLNSPTGWTSLFRPAIDGLHYVLRLSRIEGPYVLLSVSSEEDPSSCSYVFIILVLKGIWLNYEPATAWLPNERGWEAPRAAIG